MKSGKPLTGEEWAPGGPQSGSLTVASRFAFAGSVPADKSVLDAHNLLQALLKLLFHLQQKKEERTFHLEDTEERRLAQTPSAPEIMAHQQSRKHSWILN